MRKQGWGMVWMGVQGPCPPVCNDIVTSRQLFSLPLFLSQEYCPYIETVVNYWEAAKTDPNILFITYEQMKKDFVKVAR